VFDLASVAGSITVRFATGNELFTDLGSTGSVSPDPGEVIFVDGNNVVTARRWCWRQSAQSATSATTVDALVVIEGHHDTAGKDVEAALTDLISLLAAHQPDSQTTPYVLSATNPQVRSRGGNVHPGVPRTVTRTTPSWSPILTVEGS
jgi:DNA/RNA-binding domain of Phe-tRNA-synthetase-like protein